MEKLPVEERAKREADAALLPLRTMIPVPMPQLKVDWDERNERVSLFTMSGYSIGSSKDSAKGKLFEEIARRTNAYDRLVAALRKFAVIDEGSPDERAAGALLRELGEAE